MKRAPTVYSENWEPPKVPTPVIEEGCAWGRITCVPASHTPARACHPRPAKLPWGFWKALVEEVFLRLECTPRSEKLHIPLATAQIAQRAAYVLRNRASALDVAIEIVPAYQETPPALYVRRGEGWGRLKKAEPLYASLSDEE